MPLLKESFYVDVGQARYTAEITAASGGYPRPGGGCRVRWRQRVLPATIRFHDL